MRIGEISRRSGFSIDTLRFYDRIGLLRPSARNPISRFREYGDETMDLLTLVKAAKAAGFSLPKIQDVLRAARNGFACGKVIALLNEKVREIDQSIRALKELRKRLTRALRTGFKRGKGKEGSCPILVGLYQAMRRDGGRCS